MISPRHAVIVAALLPILSTEAFVSPSRQRHSRRITTNPAPAESTLLTSLSARKKKTKKQRSGEGFGNTAASSAVEERTSPEPSSSGGDEPRALTSIETAAPAATKPAVDLDPNMSEEERSRAILRQRFGLKSYEEQQADAGDYRALIDAEEKAKTRDKLRNIESLWPEDKDFFAVLPPGIVRGIDTFLKAGLGVTTTLFLLSGVFITLEAGSKATGYELPAGLEDFTVNVIEPNFTPGLGVLLAFSVSLGVFTIGLGSTASSSYREDP